MFTLAMVFNIDYFVDLCYNINIALPNLLNGERGDILWGESLIKSRVPLTRIRQLTSQAYKGGLVIIKLNLKTTLLALSIALVSSCSVYAASYKVKSGDTLGGISKAYNTTTNVLIKNNGLTNDNIYSGQVLDVPIKPQTNSKVIPYSNSDVKLLARLIHAESGGESYKAMLSVGAVVVNRVQSPQYADNISGVINEKCKGYYQFTPVMNGMINKAPSNAAIKAAYESLKGTDPTNGAMYFFDDTVTNKWLTSKKVAITLGKLTFAY